ncbi:hypothetical protein [Asanoa iriomotensis]|uniref:hypothetical protein n=1 Tax=Asanoa iriomotensis TaxID=234613 RepID=UPI0031DF7661
MTKTTVSFMRSPPDSYGHAPPGTGGRAKHASADHPHRTAHARGRRVARRGPAFAPRRQIVELQTTDAVTAALFGASAPRGLAARRVRVVELQTIDAVTAALFGASAPRGLAARRARVVELQTTDAVTAAPSRASAPRGLTARLCPGSAGVVVLVARRRRCGRGLMARGVVG